MIGRGSAPGRGRVDSIGASLDEGQHAFGVRIDVWLFAALWLAAVVPGVWTTSDLRWPYDADGFRDIAIAEHARQGRWLTDPAYAGEAAWYSPLVPGLAALASAALNLDTPAGFARVGAYVNALAPLAFWLFLRRLVGRWPALFAAAAFMFLPGRVQPWASATYSPWLFPSVTAQVPFYGALTLLLRTSDSPGLLSRVLLGGLLGVTFLAHAAAGIVLGSICVVASIRNLLARAAPLPRALSLELLPYVTSAVLIAPFLLPLATRYGFVMLNRAPATWSDESIRLADLFVDVGRAGSLLPFVLVLCGAHAVFRSNGPIVPRLLIGTWGAVSVLGYWYAGASERNDGLPALVPAYHFYFMARAWKWVLFGAGVAAVVGAAARRLSRAGWGRAASRLPAFVACLFVVATYPRYLGRAAFTTAPDESRRLVLLDDHAAYEWIRAHTDASAVFLAADEDALRIVSPAGRFVVCISRPFSSPYVDYDARARARDAWFRALAAGERDDSSGLANGPELPTHALVRADHPDAAAIAGSRLVAPAFSTGSIVIYRIRPAGQP